MILFASHDVPDDCHMVYTKGDNIYDYLVATLRPTDIVTVTISSSCEGRYTLIVYNLRDDVLRGMPDFKHIVDDLPDDPF